MHRNTSDPPSGEGNLSPRPLPLRLRRLDPRSLPSALDQRSLTVLETDATAAFCIALLLPTVRCLHMRRYSDIGVNPPRNIFGAGMILQ